MNITKNNVDALNAIVTIELSSGDYQPRVDEVLKNYKKNANVPGFRKGAVPMSLIQKQYGKAVLFEEVNKLLQDNIVKYIKEEKIAILGNPMPVEKDVDWDAETLSFDFELGLSPEFKIDLEAKNDIVKYNIKADDKTIEDQLEYLQKAYGKVVSKEKSEEGDNLKVKAVNEAENIDKESTFSINDIRTKTNQKKFIGKSVGDEITISTKGLFEDEHKLMNVLGVDHHKAHGLEIDVTFTIQEINSVEKAELNEELFNRLFPEGTVTTVEQLKEEIRKDSEKYGANIANQRFFNDVTNFLLENTKFDLPEEFLIKWLQKTSEQPITEEQAREEYKKSEQSIRYEVIQNKLVEEHKLEVSFDELKSHAQEVIKNQMAMYGFLDASEEQINSLVARVFSDQNEISRMSSELMSEKLVKLFAEKVKKQEKDITIEEFLKLGK